MPRDGRDDVRAGKRTAAFEPVQRQEVAPPNERIHASYHPQPGILPEVFDVDGDGQGDLVGLFWRAGQDRAPLYVAAFYVAAFDGRSFDLRWSYGPLPAQWQGTRTHLAIAAGRVLVGDSHDVVRILSLATGEQILERTVPSGLVEACAPDGRDALVRLDDVAPGSSQTFDLETGALGPIRKSVSCTYSGPGAAAGDLRVEVGDDVLVARRGRRTVWRAPSIVEGDAPDHGRPRIDVASGKVFEIHQLRSGRLRLVALEAESGREAWRSLVPRTEEGTYLASWGHQDRFVFVVANQTLHVFDAASGAPLAALDASTT